MGVESSQQPLIPETNHSTVPWDSTELFRSHWPGRKGWVVSEDPGSSSTLLLPGCVTLGQSLHLSRPQFPHPHDGEDNISLTALLRGSKLPTRVALYVIMVAHRICCRGGPEGREKSCVVLKQAHLEAPGPGLQNRHMAERLMVAFSSWGFRPPACSQGASLPQTSLPSQLGPSHRHCLSSLGVELGHVSTEHSSPRCSTSQPPVPARDADP